METISLKLDDEFARALNEIKQPRMKKQTLLRDILISGLKQYKIDMAVKKYMNGEVSTWKAAEIAGVSLRKMNMIFHEKGIELHYSEDSLREDME
jgi:predicted HTH domain antitoxin